MADRFRHLRQPGQALLELSRVSVFILCQHPTVVGSEGVEDSAHRNPIPKPDPPLCWISKACDNSGGGQVWVTSDRWGPFKGELLHLSYGRASVYLVLKQAVDDIMQGGIVRLVGGADAAQLTGTPVKLTSSAMRARFNPGDGQLYVTGLAGWQTDAVALTVPSGAGLVPSGWYMLFVTYPNGTPSVSRWVQIG